LRPWKKWDSTFRWNDDNRRNLSARARLIPAKGDSAMKLALALAALAMLAGCAPRAEQSVENQFRETENSIQNTAATIEAETANATAAAANEIENQADELQNRAEAVGRAATTTGNAAK
jgi:hypothetical protein